MDTPLNPRVSIVVCTFNRATLLRDCLASLERQTVDTGAFEVVVVDNNSTDGTASVAREFVDRNANFSMCLEQAVGLSNARNRGMKEARSGWVAYIDDDARAFPSYVAEMLAFVERHPDADCFGGPCVPIYHASKPSWYLDEYQNGKPQVGDGSTPLPPGEFIWGFNIVFKRATLEALGGFNPRIGMTGRKISYGEETLMQVRIRKQHGTIYFDPALIVYHYIDSYKLRLRWFFAANYANGRDSWQTFDEPSSLRARLSSLRLVFTSPIARLPRATYKLLRGDFAPENLLIECFQTSTWSLGRALSRVTSAGPEANA